MSNQARNNNKSSTQRQPERQNRTQAPRGHSRQQPSLTKQEQPRNTPLATPALQAHLRALKRAEYAQKSRAELSPSHTFPAYLRPVTSIGAPGVGHINTARWTDDDLSSVFSLANSIGFYFEPIDMKVPTLFHLFAFLYDGARQANQLVMRDSSKLDVLVRGKPQVLANRFAIFAYAVYSKIAQNPDLSAIASSTNVPFDYYISTRTNDEKPGKRRIYESTIISAAFEEARVAVKNCEPMNLVPFLDVDYQLEVEAIADLDQRRLRALEIVTEACAPIREKVQKLLDNLKNKPEKKAAAPAAEVSAERDLTEGQEGQPNPLVYTEPSAGVWVEPATDFTKLVPDVISGDAGVPVDLVEVSSQTNTAPEASQDPQVDDAEGTVVVLDAFAPAAQVAPMPA